MSNPVEQFPIIAARSYAGGAIDCLSIADAYERTNPRKTDEMLDEALAGLRAAAEQVRAAQERRRIARRPAFNPAAAAAALIGAALPWLALGGLPS